MKGLATTIRTLLMFSVIVFSTQKIQAQTVVSGNVDSNTTWTVSNSPYMVDDDIVVLEGITLTIQAGVIVKFKDHYTDMWVNGTIKAIGNSSESVVFTSYKDDSHGGDSNSDGSATSPASDDWGGVILGNSSSGNQFHYCWFGYGGGWSSSALLEIKESDAEIRNSTFTNSAERGVFSEKSALDIVDCNFTNNVEGINYNGLHATTTSVLTDNTFQNNTNWAVYGKLFDCTSDITLSGNTSTGSSHNGFGMWHWITGDVQLVGQFDFPFIVSRDDMIIGENGSLTISAGTVLKFDNYYSDCSVFGTITANGTSLNPVVFTSMQDDSHGGDTNGDGTATSPAPDDWGGIILNNTSSGNLFNYCWVGYGGGWTPYSMLDVKSSDAEINNSSFCYGNERGIYLEGSAINIRNSEFIGNEGIGLNFNGLSKTTNSVLENNQFKGNTTWAVYGRLNNCETNITLTGNSSTGSPKNGFGIYNTISSSVVFNGQMDFPFIVGNDDVVVQETGALTFTSGTCVKFETYYSDIWVYGKLTAVGTSGEPIYFTSLIDDAHGGDTNGDASETSPAADDWGTIIYKEVSSGNQLTHCWIGYGGGWSTDSNVLNEGTDLTIRNCTITNAMGKGLESRNTALDIQNTIFSENSTDGIYYNGLSKTNNSVLSNNQFTANGSWAVEGILRDCETDIILTGNSASGSPLGGFGLYGTIGGDVLFDGQPDFPFIISNSDMSINENAVLTFSAGTNVKFETYYSDIYVNGTMKAKGSSGNPIVFTSIKDDVHGGDTNGDVSETSPVADDWGGIFFQGTSVNNVLDQCWIGYGGGWSSSALVNIYSEGLELRSSTFAYSSERGVYSQDVSLHVYDCLFEGNTTDGIYYNGLGNNISSTLRDNQFVDNINWAANGTLKNANANITLSENTSSGSEHNGFGIGGTIAGGNNLTFAGQDVFPYIVGSDISVAGKLTFTPGTVIKFNDFYSDIFVDGTLDATGTAEAPIVFTSMKDDAHGGDTNGDGSTTSPGGDDWGTIQFNNTSSGNKLINCWIGYGGGWASSAMVTVYSTGLDIDNSSIVYSSNQGIYANSANPTISHSSISNNYDGIYTTAGALPEIKNNQISDNSNFGVYNADGSVDVDAKNNWWGDASGPFHATLNVGGLGNKVSDHVLFDPWNTSTNVNELKNQKGLALGQHYPNPATGNVTIPFSLEKEGRVVIELVNTDGKVIKTILDENRQRGEQNIKFNSSALANGSYFVRMVSSGISCVNRMIVVN